MDKAVLIREHRPGSKKKNVSWIILTYITQLEFLENSFIIKDLKRGVKERCGRVEEVLNAIPSINECNTR